MPARAALPAERTITEHDRLLAFIPRLCLVLIFPFSCLNKVFDYQSAMAQAAHGWIPLVPAIAALLLVLGGTLEAVGPLCILFGFYRRQAALLFIFYVVATAVLFHNFWSFPFNGDAWNENFGRSSSILGWLAVFSISLLTQGWNRCAAPFRSGCVRPKNERAPVDEWRL